MPYIVQAQRDLIDYPLKMLMTYIKTPGDMAYAITKLILFYLHQYGKNYSTLASVHGILGTVRDEFYHRVVRPYEQEKEKENGDVF